jgi:hypothetical protein
MSARLLAAFCLFAMSAPVSRAEPTLVVYLKAATGQPTAPVEEMKREAGALLQTAGYRVEWLSRGAPAPDARFLAVVELDGVCSADPVREGADLATGTGLATTSVVDGRVLPFSKVACAALRQAMSASLTGQAPAVRNFLFGRAMGRVLAHELYHVLSGAREHGAAGVARSCYSVADLTAERFDFEAGALARMRPEDSEYVGEDVSGR